MKTTVSVLSLAMLLLLATGCGDPSSAEEPKVVTRQQPTTRVYVRTVPPGAKIVIDGKAKGESDQLFTVPADVKHITVEVELDSSRGRKEVAVRGGEVTRVEFDLRKQAAARPAAVAAPSDSTRPWIEQALQKLPEGWKVIVMPQLAPDFRDVQRRLGGKITRLWNGRLLAHDEMLMINVIEAPTDADLDKIEKAMLSMKDKAFCYRADDRTIVEFVGWFDADFAKQLAHELNLPPNEEIPLARTGQVQINPPVVVRTVPPSGDVEVDPALTEIRVTFSKDMTDQSWSWSQLSDETFPQLAGQPKYVPDRRTCVLPVRLSPGRTYAIWLNSQKFTNFRDAQGNPAVPYLLIFETSGPTEE